MGDTEKIVAFKGELMLLSWGDTSTRGKTVTFQLSDETDANPFRDFTMKSGKRAGQRFVAVLVQLDDDETPVEKTPAQLAFLLCKDPQFWHFAQERSFDTIDSEEAARFYILTVCQVGSRGQLDRDTKGRAHWEAMVWQPWQKYRAALGAGL